MYAHKLNNQSVALHCFVEALQGDLRRGQKDAERILMENVVESLWHATKTMSELLLIHQRVITSFQIQLLLIIVDVCF